MTNFGTDILCIDDIRTGRLARGLLVVAQRVYHRLITPRGTLLNEGDFGFDLTAEIGRVDSPDYAGILESKIIQEVTKDSAVASAKCRVAVDRSSKARIVSVDLDCETADGPFALVLRVDNVTVELLRIG